MNNNLVKNITGVSEFNPDILETIADLSNDEVFTPPKIANNVLDLLPLSVWHNPHLKWLDPAVKTGVFLREAAKRLMEGLSKPETEDAELKYQLIHDEQFRREWIYKKMLFGIAITELTSLMARRSLYYTINASDPALSVVPMETDSGNVLFKELRHSYEKDKKGNLKGSCLKCGASLEWHRKEDLESHAYAMVHASEREIIAWFKEANSDINNEENMKFDVIIGNPPYQLANGGSSDMPLYPAFINAAISFEPKYISMIIPARWFTARLDSELGRFKAKLFGSSCLSHLVVFESSKEPFPSVDLPGGIVYFLYDIEHNSPNADLTFIKNGQQKSQKNKPIKGIEHLLGSLESESILTKVKNIHKGEFMDICVSGQNPFDFITSYSGETAYSKGAIKLYRSKGKMGWVKKVTKNVELVPLYKVLLSEANGGALKNRSIIGEPILAEPNSCCTQSHLVINSYETLKEAENQIAYIKTKLVRYLISLLKNTQHNAKDKFAYVPNLPMSQSWDDSKLYKHFGLTQEEINHIEESIRVME